MSEDHRFEVELDDGRIVHCQEMAAQPYSNCRISAGLVEGIGSDSLYFRFKRECEEPTTFFLRPDEMTALLHVCSGALWVYQMHTMDGIEANNDE